ncbi:HtaA domain-containing protein [Corynebacterium phocae]|uniref:HtaA domain-containing protein n=1 Tax=Corynebacterium phocae TaxID=161895 RepID=UPI000951BE1B|nr:HtaA domain-containing protein [Corynebacterium phocae]KAA8721657.1 hypothetical protein F4V58_10435 [Corynebacterium phocae]
MSRTRIALVAGISVAASLVTPVAATAAEDLSTCTTKGFAVKEGSLHWGIKQSWRKYILGSLARGDWSTEGAVTDNGKTETEPAFQHIFEVDPELTRIEGTQGPDGSVNISKAVVGTKKSAINYTGHHGALGTTLRSPYLEVDGDMAKVGASYIAYYVKGKSMHEYKESDRTTENRRVGTDTFTEGSIGGWKLDGDTLTLSTNGLKYKAQEGTDPHGKIVGVDIAFMGKYTTGKKVDDATVSLQVEPTCLDGKTTPTVGYETDLSTPPGDKDASGNDAVPDTTPGNTPAPAPKPDNTPAPAPKPDNTPDNTPAPKPKPDAPKQDGLDTGAIVGIVIAAIVALLGLVGAGAFFTNPGLLTQFGI